MRSGSVHRRAINTPPMPVSRLFFTVFLLCTVGPSAMAADALHPGSCLVRAEQQAAVAANRAISLAQAIKSLREHRKHSEVVRAQLCQRDEKLFYVLTLLGRSGKVVNVTINAVSGEYHAGP